MAATARGRSPTTSYWCYRCSRFVRVSAPDALVCPDCGGGFLEEVEVAPRPFPSSEPRWRRSPLDSPTASARPFRHEETAFHRPRRGSGDRSPFNPVIVLRGPADGVGEEGPGNANRAAATSFELYYDDGEGSGLRPLPAGMSDFLMGSGFDRLLDQLAQIEMNGISGRGSDHSPACKVAVESMPTVKIEDTHIGCDSHCAVCTEAFELGAEAREMPCKHIYHQDCILPWLSMRNSCPVCRHEMPTDVRTNTEQSQGGSGEEEAVGLTIWRLPGGGFAVGRFSGGRRAGNREFPVVYTEVDGGFNNSGAPRRISWTSRGSLSRDSGGISRVFRNILSFFGRSRSSSSSSSTNSRSGSESRSSSSRSGRTGSLFGRRSSRRQNTSWVLDDGNASDVSRR